MTHELTLNRCTNPLGFRPPVDKRKQPPDRLARAVARALAKEDTSILGRVNKIFERVVHRVEAVEIPLTAAETVFEWTKMATAFEHLSHLSESALEQLTEWAQPFQIITLANDVKKVARMALGSVHEGSEAIKPVEITTLSFSVVTRFCKTLTWLQNLGVITPAIAFAWRISFVGTFCALMTSSVHLGDNVIHYSSALKLVKACVNFTVSMMAVYLLFQVSAPLHLLLLILITSTLFLNVATGTDAI